MFAFYSSQSQNRFQSHKLDLRILNSWLEKTSMNRTKVYWKRFKILVNNALLPIFQIIKNQFILSVPSPCVHLLHLNFFFLLHAKIRIFYFIKCNIFFYTYLLWLHCVFIENKIDIFEWLFVQVSQMIYLDVDIHKEKKKVKWNVCHSKSMKKKNLLECVKIIMSGK